ncbi:MAG: preprotein translocase subunit SecE [Pseudomonadota bacterium]
MSTSTGAGSEGSSQALDWLKWIVVFGILGGGIFGNWFYGEQSLLYRVLALLALGTVAFLVAIQTERGRSAWTLIKEARGEIRRVVWPTWEETTQTTMVVLVLVLIFALILWLLDTGLSWIVSTVLG